MGDKRPVLVRDTVSEPTIVLKQRDYMTKPLSRSRPPTPPQNNSATNSGSDTTATGSSDEFDWNKDDEIKDDVHVVKAKRGRALWLAFMKLARPVRVLLVGGIGVAILISPLLVVETRFKGHNARPQVHFWSLWLTISWAAACITSLFVDIIPNIFLWVIFLFGGHTERLKIQMEVCVH